MTPEVESILRRVEAFTRESSLPLWTDLRLVCSTLRTLDAELVEARKDTARLEWLIKASGAIQEIEIAPGKTATFRDAIDAAMAKGKA
jgi:hypothetical protein